MNVFEKIELFYKNIIKNYKIITSLDIVYENDTFSPVIGQDQAIEIMKQAIAHKRHVLLIGLAGTGKSLLAKCATKTIPKIPIKIISCPNIAELNRPLVFTYTTDFDWAKYREKNAHIKITSASIIKFYLFCSLIYSVIKTILMNELYIGPFCHPYILFSVLVPQTGIKHVLGDLIKSFGKFDPIAEGKLIYDNAEKGNFVDATGSNVESILGDVSHDPLEGLHITDPYNDRTHHLLRAGAIHKAHKGVLYIDEIGSLDKDIQYSLLTILEDRNASIKSHGRLGSANVESYNKLPADFSLVMAGNPETVEKIHSALRSRIKGYGYEIVMNYAMDINLENTYKLIQFIGRDIKESKHLPFEASAILLLLKYAAKTSRVYGQYTLELRNFKGLIRISSDFVKSKNRDVVKTEDIIHCLDRVETIESMLVKTENKISKSSNPLKPVVLTIRASEGLTTTEEILSVFSEVKFDESTSYNQKINIPNLRINFGVYSANNKLIVNGEYIISRLKLFLQIPENRCLNIHIMSGITYRYIIEPSNFVFSILGQYYAPGNHVYIGDILDDGEIVPGERAHTLIDEALKLGYDVITSSLLKTIYNDSRITYVNNINELANINASEVWR